MAKQDVFLCGTPKQHCTGSKLVTDQKSLGDKCHGNMRDAYLCTRRYYRVILKYEEVSPRCFAPPNGGRAIMMSKESKFATRLRPGKEGNRNQPEVGRGVIKESAPMIDLPFTPFDENAVRSE